MKKKIPIRLISLRLNRWILTSPNIRLAYIALVAWLIIVMFFMIIAWNINLEIFFVLWLIGLLVIVEMVDPAFIQPQYMRYIKYLVAAGMVIFGAIMAQKVLEIINS